MTRPMGSPPVGPPRRHGPSCSGTPRDVDKAVAVVVLGARPLFMDLDCEIGAPTCAALKTGLLGDSGARCALGIPFSVSSKNVFFDRKSDEGSGSTWP